MLLLCRHGETEANREHIIQGQSESDLTATGRAQAAALGKGAWGASLELSASGPQG